MDNKTIAIKKSSSLTGLVVTLLIVIAIFTGGFLFMEDMASQSGITIDSKYNETYTNLTAARDDIDDNVNAIKNNLDDIKEADNTFQQAWNGLKGLGNTLKLPLTFVTSSVNVFEAVYANTDGMLPSWAKALILIGIIAFVVFLILSILKGDQKL